MQQEIRALEEMLGRKVKIDDVYWPLLLTTTTEEKLSRCNF